MAGFEREGERPHDARTPDQSQRSQQAESGHQRTVETSQGRPAEVILWQRPSSEQRQHAEMVAFVRQAIHLKQQEKEKRGMAGFTAAEIIQEELDRVSRSMRNPDAAIRQRGKFFYDIRRAWDVIASEHYPSLDLTLQGTTGPTTMTLSEPQARILDALAEAADVPHRKGQTVIDVPKQLRGYVRRLDQLFNNGMV